VSLLYSFYRIVVWLLLCCYLILLLSLLFASYSSLDSSCVVLKLIIDSSYCWLTYLVMLFNSFYYVVWLL
jgi:hypothetical protein